MLKREYLTRKEFIAGRLKQVGFKKILSFANLKIRKIKVSGIFCYNNLASIMYGSILFNTIFKIVYLPVF